MSDTPASTASPIPARFGAGVMSFFSDFPELVKARLTMLVLMTTGSGFLLAWKPGVDGWLFFHVLLGTAGVVAGAAVLNELLEIRQDARMMRTRERPLPAGRIEPRDALFIGVLLAGLGLAYLYMNINPLTMLMAAASLFIYLFVYTPLKRVSVWNTLVGAVPGALPPVIGWTAARDAIDVECLLFFGLQFCWQMPHFLAIAWFARHEYEKGGFRMITAVDADGKWTAGLSLAHTLCLIPLTVMVFFVGDASWIFVVGATALAVWYVRPAVAFMRVRDDAKARSLFLVSLIYLPAMYAVGILDRVLDRLLF
ncbi:MAG: heme o synthase [Candidatus Methylacidiphilales bacterium]